MQTFAFALSLGLIVIINSSSALADDRTVNRIVDIRNKTLQGQQSASEKLRTNLVPRENAGFNYTSEKADGVHEYDYKQVYKKLNTYLMEHVQQDDPEKNMHSAIDWLENDLKKSESVDQELVDAIGHLTALNNTRMCNYKDLAILRAIDNGTEGRVKKQTWLKPMAIVRRRVDKLGFHYLTKQAKDCQPSFAANLKKKYSQLDKISVERVEYFTNTIIKGYFYSPDASSQTSLMYTAIRSRATIREDELVRKNLELFAKDDPDKVYLSSKIDEREGVRLVNESKLRHLYRKYLLEPCEYYVSELKDVFEPAEFYAAWSHEVDQNVNQFYVIWFRYNQCKYNVIDRQVSLQRALFESVKNNPTS